MQSDSRELCGFHKGFFHVVELHIFLAVLILQIADVARVGNQANQHGSSFALQIAPAEDGTLIAHTVNEGVFGSGPPGSNFAGMFFEMPVFIPKDIKCADLARYEKVYSDLAERLVEDFGGRAHWGKNRRSLFQLQRRLGTYGDNMKQFRDVVKQMDPTGMFANQFGVDIGLRWPQMTTPVRPDTESQGCIP